MNQTKLPVGIQEFEDIISEGYTYVDKTQLIYQMITEGKPYFLSRPRRFGKSLLVSTLEALFLGRRELFKGLWIDQSDWDWKSYPTIRLDMGQLNNKTPEMLERSLINAANKIASQHKLKLSGETPSDYFSDLIEQLSVNGKVVVLIDEYDKPLLDQIDNLDVAQENLKILSQVYSVLKFQGKYLKFVFLTGITKFSKVSVFSGLNNLDDITMSNSYSSLLGYTRSELEHYFEKEIEDVAITNKLTLNECYHRIKEWYNGYKFSENGELVYNPFSTLKLFKHKDFLSHWFETGTPSYLIKLIKNRQFELSNLEEIDVTPQSFTSFNIENLHTLPVLYQSGYLTIKGVVPEINAITLGFPNREVSQAFSENLIKSFATSESELNIFLLDIAKNLRITPWNHTQFFEIIQKLLALIPYDLYVKHEKYFHSLFFMIVKLAGFQINAEVHSQKGRLDASLETKDKIIIFEFKMNETPQIAIDQIKQKKYHELYLDRKLPIYLVGINFDGNNRVIESWLVEALS